MEQRLSLITLGVANLQRAVDFYEQVVGWKAEPSPPGVVFFDLDGLVFALWPHDALAKDMGTAAGSIPAYRGYSLAHNARSEAEVDAIFARLKKNRATIVREPHKTFWGGYSGYFSDRTAIPGRSPIIPPGRFVRTAAYRCGKTE
jgi:catechol 2,3-dioxygenase-like lactoylglutathione lyase family enzyme